MLTLKERIDSRLQRIANVLLLNASFIDNLGLLNGKMGIAIFFYHYARYTGNEVYENYAGELIDEIYEEISNNTPIDYANGLTGIGWGVEYLVKNGFVEADTEEVLAEIDNAVFRATIRAPKSIQNQSDLFGFGLFYLARLKGREHDDENLKILEKKQLLIFMMDDCERMLTKDILFDVHVPRLTLYQVNSLIWFILQTRKLGLFPVISDKLIVYLGDYLSCKIEKIPDAIDSYIFQSLLNVLEPMAPDSNLLKRYKSPPSAIIPGIDISIEESVDQYIKSGWCPLLFNMASGNILNGEAEKAFEVIDNEANWNQRIEKLDKSNMGLDMGMAGLGLALMNERMKK